MKKRLVIATVIVASSVVTLAKKSPVFVADGSTIHGCDAVACFKDGEAVKGVSLI